MTATCSSCGEEEVEEQNECCKCFEPLCWGCAYQCISCTRPDESESMICDECMVQSGLDAYEYCIECKFEI